MKKILLIMLLSSLSAFQVNAECDDACLYQGCFCEFNRAMNGAANEYAENVRACASRAFDPWDMLESYTDPSIIDGISHAKDLKEFTECMIDERDNLYREMDNYDKALCACMINCGCGC